MKAMWESEFNTMKIEHKGLQKFLISKDPPFLKINSDRNYVIENI